MALGEDEDTLPSEETMKSWEALLMPSQVFSPGTSLTFSGLNEASASEVMENVLLSEEPRVCQGLSSGLREQFLDFNTLSLPTLDEIGAYYEEMDASQDDCFNFYAKSFSLIDGSMLPLAESQEFRTFSVETPETTTVETQVPLHCTERSRAQEYQLYSTERRSIIQPEEVPMKYVKGKQAKEYRLHSTARRSIAQPGEGPVQYAEGKQAQEYRRHSIERSTVQSGEVPVQYVEGIQAHPTERVSIAGRGPVTQRQVEGSRSPLHQMLSTKTAAITQPEEIPVQYDGRGQAHRTERTYITQRDPGSQLQVKRTFPEFPGQRHSLNSTERISIGNKRKFLEQKSIQHPIEAEKPGGAKHPYVSAIEIHVPRSSLASVPKPALGTGGTGDKEVLMCVHCQKCLLLTEQYKLDCIKHRWNSSQSESLEEIYPVLSLVQLLRTNYRCLMCEAKFCDLHNYTCHLKCRHRFSTLTLCENCKKSFRSIFLRT